MRLAVSLTWGLALMFGACGGKSGGDDDDAATAFDSVEVSPASATVNVVLGASATQDYVVYGVRGTTKREITATCLLSIDASFGAFAGPTVTISPHGGKTPVRAACGTLTGSGELIVHLSGSVVDPSAPPNAGDVFGGATPGTDAARLPVVEYPIDQAVSPRNIPAIEMQWKAAGNDLFHVALRSSYGTVDFYTGDVKATLSAVDWDAVAGTAAGEQLQIVVEGLSLAAPTTKYAAATTHITMSTDKVDNTAIYYWASSKGNIMSQTFGEPTAPALVKDGCTSCHSVSRSGSRIGYSRCVKGDCGQLYAGFLRYDGQTWNEAVNADGKAIQGSYTTFAPLGNPFTSDEHAVAMVSLANGSLALYDPDSGAPIASNIALATSLPNTPRSVLMADWSPDGRRVAYTATPNANQWIDLDGGRIAVMSYNFTANQHVFGDPHYLVPDPITLPSGTYTNFFFPSFSPDGAVIVFDAARKAWRDNQNAASPGQRLMLTDPEGKWVTDLTAMNGGDGDANVTWAHWSPAASNDYYWVVFSSERDYGHEITAGNTAPSCLQNGVKQCKQIWIGAIAKNKIGTTGVDPSAPPMWLPGQDTQTDNISPFWSVPAGLQ